MPPNDFVAPIDQPQKKKMSGRKKLIIFIIVLIVGVPLLIVVLPFLLFLFVVSSWISENDLRDRQPTIDPHATAVVEARQTTADNLDATLEDLAADNEFTFYASSSDDICHKGSPSDFGTDSDPFNNRCILRVTHFYSFNGDFRENMADFERNVQQKGWRPRHSSMTYILVNYYDKYYGDDKPKPGNDEYLVSNMPTPTYIKADELIDIEYAERRTKNRFKIGYRQEISGHTTFYEDNNTLDEDEIFEKATENHQYLLSLTTEKVYFEDKFKRFSPSNILRSIF